MSAASGTGATRVDPDGFGQSFADDLRFLWRFQRCRARAVDWRRPAAEEEAHIAADPLLSRFGDATEAVAVVDGRRWVIRSRTWHGWPDPPEHVFFAVEPGGMVWCARDFDRWPTTWSMQGR